MYCLNCHHDLRDVAGEHCPQCGGWFARERPETYGRSAGPERLHAILRQASELLAEAMSSVGPLNGTVAAVEPEPVVEATPVRTVDPSARAIAALRRQVMRVLAENWELRQQVAALTQVLLDRGVVDAIALAAATERAAAMAEAPIIVEDADDLTVGEGEPNAEELTTPELLDLRRAVDSHVLGDG